MLSIYFLKANFIEKVVKEDSEFKTDIMRPYMSILIQSQGDNYLIPMSRSKRKLHCFTITNDSHIHFEKCFKLLNMNIIDREMKFGSKDAVLKNEIASKKELIIKSFENYLKKHPTIWSVNQDVIETIQIRFK